MGTMSGAWCEVCGEYALHRSTHVCPPEWRVGCPEFGEGSARMIRAHDPELAASRFAENEDRSGAEYLFARGEDLTVIVADPRGREGPYAFTIEIEPNYIAIEAPVGDEERAFIEG